MPVCLYIAFTERRDTAYRWLRSRTCNLHKLFYLLFRLGSTNIRDKAVGLKVRFAQTHRHCSRHNTTLYLTHQHISVSASKSFLQTVNTFTKQENSEQTIHQRVTVEGLRSVVRKRAEGNFYPYDLNLLVQNISRTFYNFMHSPDIYRATRQINSTSAVHSTAIYHILLKIISHLQK
jgi:hypothetical protein